MNTSQGSLNLGALHKLNNLVERWLSQLLDVEPDVEDFPQPNPISRQDVASQTNLTSEDSTSYGGRKQFGRRQKMRDVESGHIRNFPAGGTKVENSAATIPRVFMIRNYSRKSIPRLEDPNRKLDLKEILKVANAPVTRADDGEKVARCRSGTLRSRMFSSAQSEVYRSRKNFAARHRTLEARNRLDFSEMTNLLLLKAKFDQSLHEQVGYKARVSRISSSSAGKVLRHSAMHDASARTTFPSPRISSLIPSSFHPPLSQPSPDPLTNPAGFKLYLRRMDQWLQRSPSCRNHSNFSCCHIPPLSYRLKYSSV